MPRQRDKTRPSVLHQSDFKGCKKGPQQRVNVAFKVLCAPKVQC